MEKKRKASELDSSDPDAALDSSSDSSSSDSSDGEKINSSSDSSSEEESEKDSDEKEIVGEKSPVMKVPKTSSNGVSSAACFDCGHHHPSSPCTINLNQYCFSCGEKGHSSTKCPILSIEPFCYRCGHNSHSAATCTSTLPFVGNATITCDGCGHKTHRKDTCEDPLYPNNIRLLIHRSYYKRTSRLERAREYMEKQLEQIYNFSLEDVQHEAQQHKRF